jgi:hypothetical protein
MGKLKDKRKEISIYIIVMGWEHDTTPPALHL